MRNNKKRQAGAAFQSDGDQSSSSDSDSDDGQNELSGFMSGTAAAVVASSSSSSSFTATKSFRNRGRKERKEAKAARKSDRAGFSKEDAEEAFEDMEGRRIGDKCKEKYKGMMSQIEDFGKRHYDDLMEEDGSLPCPIPVDIVKGFFGTYKNW